MIHFDGQAISIQVMLQEKLTGHIFSRNVHGFLLQPHQSDIKTLSTLVFPPFHKRGVDLLGDLSLFISLLRRYFCQTVIIDKIISIKNCLRRDVFLCMRIFLRQIYEKYVYTPKCPVFLIFRRSLYNVGSRNMYSINFFNLRAIRVLWVVFSSFKHKAPFKLYGFSSAFAVSLPILSRSAIKSTFT